MGHLYGSPRSPGRRGEMLSLIKGSRSRGTTCPSFSNQLPSLHQEGAGNAGCPMHPQPRVQEKSTRVSNHRYTANSRHSLRDGFTAYTWSPRGPGFLAPVVRVMRSIIANLTPASGRQDHTTSPST